MLFRLHIYGKQKKENPDISLGWVIPVKLRLGRSDALISRDLIRLWQGKSKLGMVIHLKAPIKFQMDSQNVLAIRLQMCFHWTCLLQQKPVSNNPESPSEAKVFMIMFHLQSVTEYFKFVSDHRLQSGWKWCVYILITLWRMNILSLLYFRFHGGCNSSQHTHSCPQEVESSVYSTRRWRNL